MKRFAIFVKYYSITGSDPWLTDDLVSEITHKNNDVTVFFFDIKGENKKGLYIANKNCRVYTFPLKGVSGSSNLIRMKNMVTGYLGMFVYFIPKFLRGKFTHVIGFSMFSIFFLCNFLIRLANKNVYSIAILWDFYPIHSYEIGKLKSKLLLRVLYYMENFELRHFDKICFMTKKSINFFERYHPNLAHKEKIVIYLWRSTSHSFVIKKTNLMKFDPDLLYVVFGGQLSKGRGFEFLLKVSKEYKSKLDNIHFIIIGDGELKIFLQDQITKNDLSNITMLGRVNRTDYMSILSNADIGLVVTDANVTIPSFPSKTIDYMLTKLPIIASIEASSDYGDIIENVIGCGLSSISGDAESFVKNLLRLKADNQLRHQMGNKGFKFFHKSMTTSKVIDKILR